MVFLILFTVYGVASCVVVPAQMELFSLVGWGQKEDKRS
jgi:hypothetical protein